MSCARPCAQGAFCSSSSAYTNPLIGLQAPLYAHAPVSPLRACHTPEHHSQVPTPQELREEVVELAFECKPGPHAPGTLLGLARNPRPGPALAGPRDAPPLRARALQWIQRGSTEGWVRAMLESGEKSQSEGATPALRSSEVKAAI